MAFPIPAHLPRKQDVSSKILSKIGEAESLSAELATSWLVELDETIQLTKGHIHERIHKNLPYFEQQLSSSKSVQTRLQQLTVSVDGLSDVVSNSETGIITTLVRTLTRHAALAQESMDTGVYHEALAHLLRCRSSLSSLSSLEREGKLPEAVEACVNLDVLLNEAPLPLSQAQVMVDLKRKFRAVKDRTEEQLGDAYSRSIVVSPSQLIIRPSVQIRQSNTVLSLPSILASLSATSITALLTTLRRDLTTHYIDHILQQPVSMTVTKGKDFLGEPEHTLAQFPAPPNTENRLDRLQSLSIVLDFLYTRLFSHLPISQLDAFPRTLAKPVTTGILQHLLIPALPVSLERLPPFLTLVNKAVEFEERYVVDLLGSARSDREVKAWADGVGGHYERKRRLYILENARAAVTNPEGMSQTFRAEVPQEQNKVVPEIPVTNGQNGREEDENLLVEEDNWGLDEPEPEPEVPPTDEDAWGWNDDAEETPAVEEEGGDDTVWDDPWGDEPDNSATVNPSLPVPAVKAPPKPLTNGHSHSHSHSTPSDHPSGWPAEPPKPHVPIETYLVSSRTRDVLKLVEDTLREGAELASSRLFTSHSSSPGTLLLRSAFLVVDLYRALHPVIHGPEPKMTSTRMVQSSNDFLYMSGEIMRIEKTFAGLAAVQDRVGECKETLKVLGDSWFDDAIEKQRQVVRETLAGADGFTFTGDQDRYDECESIASQVLRDVRSVAQQWKNVLAPGKYYVAVGLVVEAALSQVLGDILALPDIPEVESHRLSDLCKILNALEGLFVRDPNEPSFVVAYVPSWLKYSYLSELLEASIADISYLFEEGALVDFEVEELVNIVRALFADTPLRANTINKLLAGHPSRQ